MKTTNHISEQNCNLGMLYVLSQSRLEGGYPEKQNNYEVMDTAYDDDLDDDVLPSHNWRMKARADVERGEGKY
jgi:hypothetical protein